MNWRYTDIPMKNCILPDLIRGIGSNQDDYTTCMHTKTSTPSETVCLELLIHLVATLAWSSNQPSNKQPTINYTIHSPTDQFYYEHTLHPQTLEVLLRYAPILEALTSLETKTSFFMTGIIKSIGIRAGKQMKSILIPLQTTLHRPLLCNNNPWLFSTKRFAGPTKM